MEEEFKCCNNRNGLFIIYIIIDGKFFGLYINCQENLIGIKCIFYKLTFLNIIFLLI